MRSEATRRERKSKKKKKKPNYKREAKVCVHRLAVERYFIHKFFLSNLTKQRKKKTAEK